MEGPKPRQYKILTTAKKSGSGSKDNLHPTVPALNLHQPTTTSSNLALSPPMKYQDSINTAAAVLSTTVPQSTSTATSTPAPAGDDTLFQSFISPSADNSNLRRQLIDDHPELEFDNDIENSQPWRVPPSQYKMTADAPTKIVPPTTIQQQQKQVEPSYDSDADEMYNYLLESSFGNSWLTSGNNILSFLSPRKISSMLLRVISFHLSKIPILNALLPKIEADPPKAKRVSLSSIAQGVKKMCSMTVAQQLEADYDELWVRSAISRNKKELLFYVIPGNPGLVKAYVWFAKLLSVRFAADVCIVSHLGHCCFSKATYDLYHQIQHHTRVLRKHSRDYSAVSLIGHSIGGFIGMEIIENSVTAKLATKIRYLGLIAPVVSGFPFRSYCFLKVVSSSLFQNLITRVLPFIPLVHYSLNSEVVNELRGGQFMRNILSLVGDELKSLPPTLTKEFAMRAVATSFASGCTAKTFIIYPERDFYVHGALQALVKYVYDYMGNEDGQQSRKVTIVQKLHHSFCLHLPECRVVVDMINDFTKNGGFTLDMKNEPDFQKTPTLWSALSCFVFGSCYSRKRQLN